MTDYSEEYLATLTSLISRTYIKRDADLIDIGEPLPSGWVDLNFMTGYLNAPWLAEFSMQVEVYENNGQFVIAFDGLQPLDYEDVVAMVSTYFGSGSVQYPLTIDLVQAVMDRYGISANQIVITGHSLGGAMAQLAGAYYGIEAVTFNPLAIANQDILTTTTTTYLYNINGEFIALSEPIEGQAANLVREITIPGTANPSVTQIDNYAFVDDIGHNYGVSAQLLGDVHTYNLGEGFAPPYASEKHALSFTRFCAYVGFSTVEAWHAQFPYFFAPIVDSSLFSDSGDCHGDGSTTGDFEVFLFKIIDILLQGNSEPFDALVQDLQAIVEARGASRIDEPTAIDLVRLLVQQGELNLANAGSEDPRRLVMEDKSALAVDLTLLPKHVGDQVEEWNLPGALTIVQRTMLRLTDIVALLPEESQAAVADAVFSSGTFANGSYTALLHGLGSTGTSYTLDNDERHLIAIGLDGADKITGAAGNDLILGGNGANQLNGLKGDDIIVGGEDGDTLNGGEGNDVIIDEDGANVIDGGKGNDVAIGGIGSDTLSGGDNNDALFGGKGADELNGGEGDDTLDGGVGGDELTGGKNRDTFIVDDGDVIKDPEDGDRVSYKNEFFLTGATRTAEEARNGEPWVGKNGEEYSYDNNGNLIVDFADGSKVTIEGFMNGEAGIRLLDLPDDPSGFASPLVLDLDGDGLELISLAKSGAYFDIDNDGVAEHTGWVAPSDGLLALDRDGNGQVNGVSELFGAGYVSPSISLPSPYQGSASGFASLAALDENGDNKIDANDGMYQELLIWRDLNGDGYSAPGELMSLASAGIISVSLDRQNVQQTNAGNLVTELSTFTRADGTSGSIADVWFAYDPAATIHHEADDIDPAIAELPFIAGIGEIPDLHVAMAGDPVLRSMVEELTTLAVSDASLISAKVENIILRWAGVEGIGDTSRGSNVDGQHLAAVQKMLGFVFRQQGDIGPDGYYPRPQAGQALENDWYSFLSSTIGKLVCQTPLAQTLLPGIEFKLGAFFVNTGGTTLAQVLDAIAANGPTGAVDKIRYWHSMALALDGVASAVFSETRSQFIAAVNARLSQEQIGLTFAQLTTQSRFASGDGDSVVGTANFVEILMGDSGDNVLSGRGDADPVRSDIYIVGRNQGNDQIINASGGDVRFVDLLESEVSFSLGSDPLRQDLVVEFAGGGSLTIVGQHATERPEIKNFVFADGTVLNWSDVAVFVQTRSPTGDLIIAPSSGDTLTGGNGNDTFLTSTGNDTVTVNLGDGSDTIKAISGSAGSTDKLLFGEGVSADDIQVRLSGDDLIIRLTATGEQVSIIGQYSQPADVIDQVVFSDGKALTAEDVRLLGLANTDGDDAISGSSRSDTMAGGKGTDVLQGGGDDDIYIFNKGDGFDTISDGRGSNVLSFGVGIAASDLMFAHVHGSADIVIQIAGTQDAVQIIGFIGQAQSSIQEIRFADGNALTRSEIEALLPVNISAINVSTIYDYWDTPAGVDDFYELGAGRDVVDRFDANDVFVFGRGSGYDTIINTDNFGFRVVQFGTGVMSDDIVISAAISDWGAFDGYAYDFRIKGTNDHLVIMYEGVDELRFADGTIWTWQQALDRYYAGTSGDDHIVTHKGDQVLDGGISGNDTLAGGSGNDSYIFGRGYGNDTIAGWGASNTTDKVIFADGITATDVTFSLITTELGWGQGTGIRVSIDGSDDSLAVHIGSHIDQYVFEDGTVLSRDAVIALANGGNDTIHADTLTHSKFVDAGAGDDIVYGVEDETVAMSAGNDVVYGHNWSSNYLFSLGDGQDIIVETGVSWSDNDRLIFGPGIAAANVSVTCSGYDLVLSINGTSDQVTIKDALAPNATTVDKIEFSDGTIWTPTQLLSEMNANLDGNNLLYGLSEYDSKGGNDRLIGGTIDNIYRFDAGYDSDTILDLGGSNDRVVFGSSIDAAMLQTRRADDGQSITLEFFGLSDSLTIEGGIEGFDFSDGTSLSLQQLLQPLLDAEATEGADTIVGVAGSLTLDGGGGNDTYQTAVGNTIVFGPGSGNDIVPSNASGVSIQFADGITPTSILLARSLRADGGEDLVIGLRGQSDTLTIEKQFTSAHQVTSFIFSDGTVWSQIDMQQAVLAGSVTARNDTLVGSEGNDVVDGREGNDAIIGGKGDDTYVFGFGSGHDTIKPDAAVSWYGPFTYGADRILFGPGIAFEDLTITPNGANSITIGLPGGADSLTLELGHYEWEAAVAIPISQFEFADGSIVSSTDLLAQVYSATNGDDVLTTATFEWYGGNEYSGADYDGGAGNDLLIGAGGGDVYVFGRGYGTDTVVEEGYHYQLTWGDDYVITDVVKFTADVAPGDLRLLRGGLDLNDLVIEIVGTGDRLIISDQFDQFAGMDVSGDAQHANGWLDGVYFDETTTIDELAYYEFMNAYSSALGVDQFHFADGTVWDREKIAAMVTGEELLDGDNILTTTDAGGMLDGGAGNDRLNGGKGEDIYVFGRGYAEDQVFDAGGIDTVEFKDIDLADIAFSRSGPTGENLLVEVDGVERLTLTVQNQFVSESNRVEFFNFAGGVQLTWQDVQNTLLSQAASDQNDLIQGFITSDLLNGLTGDDSLSGGAGNDTLNGGLGSDKLIGGIGDDTYAVDNVGEVLEEKAGEGLDTVVSTVSWTLGGNIENLTLSGIASIGGIGNELDNLIIGNGAANTIVGGSGSDTLNGSAGADLLVGGTGNDTYIVDDAGDVVVEMPDQGIDSVNSAVTYGLGETLENLTLTGSANINGAGNASDNFIIGNSGANQLTGGDGNDLLDGRQGADTLSGGTGDDTYVIDNALDQIIEAANEGVDVVKSTVSWVLGNNVDNLTLIGDAAVNGTGNSLDNVLLGNKSSNELVAGLGNDTLDGGGSADTLKGGLGNDVYIVNAGLDVVVEEFDEGVDRVYSSATYALSANIEELILTGTFAINATGNELDNILWGNAENNVLSGGAGIDTLIGGAGSDTYILEQVSDVAVENANEGVDTVETTFSYVLGANLENLTLSGANTVDGTGNELVNILTGNASDNRLDGGLGADVLAGGSGNDIYVVDNIGDLTVETAGSGVDTVESTISWTLAAEVENLSLVGADAINGTGNGLNNSLTGNAVGNKLSGAAGDDILDGGIGADTLIGGSGNDTYFVDDAGDLVTEFANEGTDTVRSSIGYALTANVENLVLEGSDAIDGTGNALNNIVTGNSGNNVLSGAAGNDVLDGGVGADTLVGGTGNDIYTVDDTGDVVTENSGEGTDLVRSAITYALGANVENLLLIGDAAIDGTGNTLNNAITGNNANNFLAGGSGNDTLDGGVGADTLIGGTGNDLYLVDDINDVIIENAGEGTDTIHSSVSYMLAANVENLILIGNAAINGTGNELSNTLTGNSANNQLWSGAGNDALDGGAGVDTLVGGAGNDIYTVDDSGDVAVEETDEGTDTVQSSANYTLSSNIENLTLTGSAGISATGNGLNNGLTGNSGANELSGGAGNDTLNGGSGADTSVGGTGDDLYHVDNTGDVTTEGEGEGTDTVQSSIAWTLAANIENLTLTGSTPIYGVGNELDNVITGNAGANQLSGGAGDDTLVGGAGADTLTGGTGNDTYTVDIASDVVTESADEGTDLVQSSVTYTLAANVENLILIGSSTISGTGNELDNVLTGNTGANQLIGGAGNDRLDGGAGNDAMTGGSGNDIYVVQQAGDVVTESADEGIDTVESAITIGALAANVENLVLTGTSAINGTGNGLGNVITGNTASNVLDGGVGADTLAGGIGNDTYLIDNIGDAIVENVDEGTDLVQSSVTYTLAANVENLTLTGSDAIDGTGNELDNLISGNTGTNQLSGGAGNDTLNGAAGADTLLGGAGDDTYLVDNAGDVATEDVDGGIDLVQSAVTYALAANIENLTLTGSAAINGTGNELDNVLIGNAGVNQLVGGAGNDRLDGAAGNDTMIGGTGNDTYVVQAAGDVVTESAGEGIDTVESSITIAALAGNVENLVLTGATAINGTGNDLDNVITGNSGNNLLNGGIGADTLIGGAGGDTYVVDSAGDVTIENAGEGTDLVQSSVAHTLAANIENLTLTGSAAINGTGNEFDNALTGNTGANLLAGGAGNDTLNGGTGADTLVGGFGNDVYLVDNAGDVTTEGADEGTDLVQSSVTYTLAAHLENLTLTGSGSISGIGNDLNNVINGNNGHNVLDGGIGADTLAGGAGNDTYVVDDAGDVLTENLNQGTADLVQSSVGWSLGANLENLTLTGSAIIDGAGNELNNAITGNSATNQLSGGAGNDTLNGGADADTLVGGTGDDTYIVDNAGDLTVEAASEGTDTVQSSVTWALASEIEHLTLTGSAAINGTGNDFANALTGNTGANQLIGGVGNDTLNGGAAADTLIGGVGDDLYVVDNASDVISELEGEGTDLVQSSVTHALAANVENLTLTGSSAINGTGNALDNIITGNGGANVLNGGAGADTLSGGAGNDTYVVDDAGDVIIENAGQGTADLVQSSIGWALAANFENLTLTGSDSINGAGNEINNALTGNSGANQLSGGDGHDTLNGGAGADTLVGGTGNDTYVVDNSDDVTSEIDGEGTDTVQSSVTWALATAIESLTLTGTAAINGTGNDLDNVLIGNTGANQLVGGAGNDMLNGGAGIDTLVGGAGNDTYVVDHASDVVTESADEGTDLVQSSASYTLAANLENLTLTGSSAINGTGNDVDNIIIGNSGANQLNGGAGNDRLDGGAGNDKMTGSIGDDTYVVQAAGDIVTENAGEGIDTIESSVTISALASNVEHLILTGASAIGGTGNALDNALTGNSAANTLDGGLGNDTLLGGAGADNLIGGDGDDLLIWDGIDTLNGGAGRDTLAFGSNGTLQFDSSRMLNMEIIDLGAGDDNNNAISLSLADVLDLASSSGGSGLFANGDDVDLVILGDADGGTRDDVSLTGGWTANGTLTTSDVTGTETTFNLYIAGGVQVAIQQGVDELVA